MTARDEPYDSTPSEERQPAANARQGACAKYSIACTWSERLRSLAIQINSAIDVDDLHIDHRKIITIDRKIAYCGGAKVDAQYMFHVPFDPTKSAEAEGSTR
ncbi:MAG: hypothetical protein ABI421_02050 [Polyangiaceae bacterium]